jgi:hypothetical protein
LAATGPERSTRPRPAIAIPGHPDDVTAEWLSAVLSGPGSAVGVCALDLVAIGTGQTGATFRVTPRYLNHPPGLPATFVIKLPVQDDTVRDRVAISYRSECAFYANVTRRVQVPVPRCYYCDVTDDATRYALLLADQAPAVQGDQIAGCGEHDAILAVTALAGLHGPSWCDPVWLDFPGIVFARPDEDAAQGLGQVAQMSADITLNKLGEQMTRADRDTFTTAMGMVTPWLLAESERFSLLHGDYRLDNMLFDRDNITVVDWQTLGVGLPARDLAYFTATSLDPELRSTIEQDLVATYHRSLCSYGVSGYDNETCWYDYRLGMLQALLISALGFAFATATDRGDDMVLTMLRRGCRAIRELQTVDLIGRYAEDDDRR